MDQSLALALEHLSLPYHTRVQTCTQRDVGIHMNHHTQTDAQTHGDVNGCPSATCTDPYLEMSTWMDRRYGKMTSWCFHRLCPWKVIILDFFVRHSRPSGLYDSHQKKPKKHFFLSERALLSKKITFYSSCVSKPESLQSSSLGCQSWSMDGGLIRPAAGW